MMEINVLLTYELQLTAECVYVCVCVCVLLRSTPYLAPLPPLGTHPLLRK